MLGVQTVKRTANKGFRVGNHRMQPFQVIRIIVYIELDWLVIIFFSECIVRSISVATDRRTWLDVLFCKLDKRLTFHIWNHLHFDVLQCSLLIERNPNKHRCLIRAAPAFAPSVGAPKKASSNSTKPASW